MSTASSRVDKIFGPLLPGTAILCAIIVLAPLLVTKLGIGLRPSLIISDILKLLIGIFQKETQRSKTAVI